MKKYLLMTLGILCLLLGGIGIAIPVLPTTPFVLLASGCFAASSPKLYQWLIKTKYFGEFIENYKTKSGVRKSVKIKALAFLYITLAISFFFVDSWYVQLILALVALCVTIHIVMIKTRKEK